MKDALQQLVQSAQYLRFDFEDDMFAPQISGCEIWQLMERVIETTGPIVLLLRLGDSNATTLPKLKGTVDFIQSKMVDSGDETLEDQICVTFNNRAPELECDIASAAYVLDPQFVIKS